MFIYNDYNNTYSDYDSDNCSHSTDSSLSSSRSYGSYNSSNFTITSVPSNYYRNDNPKQNYQKFSIRLWQTQRTQRTQRTLQTQLIQHNPNCVSISLRKKQTQNYLEMHRHKINYKRDIGQVNKVNIDIVNNIGYDSGFNKDTPFINYLISKRISFCELGASSHIAAFIPSVYSQLYCLIREWKWKDRYW